MGCIKQAGMMMTMMMMMMVIVVLVVVLEGLLIDRMRLKDLSDFMGCNGSRCDGGGDDGTRGV